MSQSVFTIIDKEQMKGRATDMKCRHQAKYITFTSPKLNKSKSKKIVFGILFLKVAGSLQSFFNNT